MSPSSDHALRGLGDIALLALCVPLAYALRVDVEFLEYGGDMALLGLVFLPCYFAVLRITRLELTPWSRFTQRDLTPLLQTVGLVALIHSSIPFFLRFFVLVPRSVPILATVLSMVLLGGARVLARQWADWTKRLPQNIDGRRVLIVGAGEAGAMVVREMHRHPESGLCPVGFVDDDPAKRRLVLSGVGVMGPVAELGTIAARLRAEEVVIAAPSAGGVLVRRVVELAREAGVRYRIVPGMFELLAGAGMAAIRDVDLNDLLRRPPIEMIGEEIGAVLNGRVVMVTGAGGSIGSELCRQLLAFGPSKIVLVERGENSLYHVHRELTDRFPEMVIAARIADIGDVGRMRSIFTSERPEVLFHAAAHKHVPMMEWNPCEAVKNNVIGTRRLADLAAEHGLSVFVMVSTDKAVNPTSIMGASKRIAELYVHSLSARSTTQFVTVRFGNVLGSAGSVVPLFQEQIRRGGPVTVTHPEMRRFFMTIPEACQLVLQAAALGRSSEVFVLDMGEPVRVVDLARDLITLSGRQPGIDISIEFSGVRPGEKLYEELATEAEGLERTRHPKIFTGHQQDVPPEKLATDIAALESAAESEDPVRLRIAIQQIVPEYRHSTGRVPVVRVTRPTEQVPGAPRETAEPIPSETDPPNPHRSAP